jgi:uroporphyrin-III C-methyltransferase
MPDTTNILKVISRNSTLAFQQVAELFNLYPGIRYELMILKSAGSLHEDKSQQGRTARELFTAGPARAVLLREADLTIHSAGDLPYPLPNGLAVAALIDAADPSRQFEILGIPGLFSEILPPGTDPGQDYLAVVTREEREDLKVLFSAYDVKKSFGKVTLVGFGPGNPDLLTLGGDMALSEADVIFHDDLLDKEFLKKYAGEKVYVGKRKDRHSFDQDQINRLLLEAAKSGKQVVRLKGGDPMVFAHGGEEVEYLQRNLVDVRVIPGVSAGMAASSYSKIPLTQRLISSSVAFISGHTDSAFLPNTDTLVIYMGGSTIKKIAARAIQEGRDPETPVIMVYNVSLPDQKEFFFTLQELSLNDAKYPTPVIIIIGEVVSLRNHSAAELQKSDTQAGRSEKKQAPSLKHAVYHPLNRIEKIELLVNYNGN